MVKPKVKSPIRNRIAISSRPATRTRPIPTPNLNDNGANIRVVVRVRPQNNREQGENFRNVVKIIDEHLLIFDPKQDDQPFFYHGVKQKGRDLLKRANKNLQFLFDRVFGFDSTNEHVYEDSTRGLIKSLMDGYNCSVFVYGATGAGKTHTMLGQSGNHGITFLTMAELFRCKEELSTDRDFELGISYLEVYNETVQDLLCPGTALHLREDGNYGVIVANIQVKQINSPEELFELLEKGNRNRTQHPTDANAESSRSHAVFQVYLRMNFRASGEVRLSKLSMIDLAGSERGAATGCSGARFTEGANINKSLLALGNCINSLADGQRHIPYRDSKLTRLLKDSLGGNCRTVMIANVSPSSLSFEDTYNTLKYATRAKKIKLNVKKNVVNCEMNIKQYMKLVEDLTKENGKLKQELIEKRCNCASEAAGTSRDQLAALFGDKRQLQHRRQQLESTEQLLALRKQIKEKADARLSGLCCDTPQKKQGHRKLGLVVEKLQRQSVAINIELDRLKMQCADIDENIKKLLEQAPEINTYAELETAQLAEMTAKNQADHMQKVCSLLEGEIRVRDQLFDQMSTLLKPCYLQLRGHGLATEALTRKYQGLERQWQGLRSVTWCEDTAGADSGVGSTATLNDDEEVRPPKRKLTEDATNILDSTYSLSQPKSPALNVCAEQLMAKVYKAPAVRRPIKIGHPLSKVAKENRVPLSRRPLTASKSATCLSVIRSKVKPGTQKVLLKERVAEL